MALAPVFSPGKFQGQRCWWATVHGVTESDMTEQLSTCYIIFIVNLYNTIYFLIFYL